MLIELFSKVADLKVYSEIKANRLLVPNELFSKVVKLKGNSEAQANRVPSAQGSFFFRVVKLRELGSSAQRAFFQGCRPQRVQ